MRWFRRRRRDQLSCHQVAQVLQTYLDHELDEAGARAVAAHLDECRRCGLEAEVYEQLKASLVAHASRSVDAEAIARLRDFGHRLVAGEGDHGHAPT